MTETRRNLFRTSILSLFGTMSGLAVVKAAAHGRSDDDKGPAPILVRAKDALYLLKSRDDGDWDAFEVHVGEHGYLPPNLTADDLAHMRGVDLHQLSDSRDLFVHDKTAIRVKDGVVRGSDIRQLITSDASWSEIEMRTFAWTEIPGRHN